MMKKVLKYISNNWLGLIGTIFGIIGVTLSIYFYKLSVLERVPAMLVNPSRIHIISSERTMKVPIEIHSKSGKVIEDDISLIKIYLWNAGKLSIKKENILKNIQITIGEEKNEILDHQIINQTRDIIEGALFTDKNSPKNAINVSFNILEYNDGLTIQLIYIGKPDSIVKISGIFEGANGFLQEDELLNKQFWPEFMYTILSILIFGLFLILFAKIDKWIETNREKDLSNTGAIKRIFINIAYITQRSFMIIFVIFMLLAALSYPFLNAKSEAKSNIIELVPEKLIES